MVDSADVLLNIKSLVKSHIAQIATIKSELKNLKGTVDGGLKNDMVYQKYLETFKEATKVKNNTKTQLLNQQNLKTIVEKIHDMKSQLKGLQSALSEYLREYQRLSRSNQIEGQNGEVLEIVYVAKLVPSSAKRSA